VIEVLGKLLGFRPSHDRAAIVHGIRQLADAGMVRKQCVYVLSYTAITLESSVIRQVLSTPEQAFGEQGPPRVSWEECDTGTCGLRMWQGADDGGLWWALEEWEVDP
jgi:hypothetical protein